MHSSRVIMAFRLVFRNHDLACFVPQDTATLFVGSEGETQEFAIFAAARAYRRLDQPAVIAPPEIK